MTPREAFADQARSCRLLGSELTARICERLGAALQRQQGAVARRILDWPGDGSSRADSVPLRLAGALHALVLDGRAPDQAAAYLRGDPGTGALLAAIQAHEGFMLPWLDSPPQTNEVGRSAAILAAAHFAVSQRRLPLAVLELGTSAGLNLNFHRYLLAPEGAATPSPDPSAVILNPAWRGVVPQADITVASAEGVDLRPLDPVRDGSRLLAYCWADQKGRLDRLRAALAVARAHPPMVATGEAADWLEEKLAQPAPGLMRFVFHTVAWQYFPSTVRARCEAALRKAGAAATPDAPLAHLAMEADDTGPGAGLRLRLWDGKAQAWSLGRADFHGRWVDWQPVPG